MLFILPICIDINGMYRGLKVKLLLVERENKKREEKAKGNQNTIRNKRKMEFMREFKKDEQIMYSPYFSHILQIQRMIFHKTIIRFILLKSSFM